MKRSGWMVAVVLVLATVYWWCSKSDEPAPKPKGDAGETSRGAKGGPLSSIAPGAPMSSLGGVVVDSRTQRGVPGATVAVERGRAPGAPPLVSVTDDDGRFVFEELAAGAYSVRAEAEGAYAPRTLLLNLGPQESRRDLRIEVVNGGAEIVGTISDIGGGPVGGAVIAVEPVRVGGRVPGAVAVSDDNGRYKLRLPDGYYHLSASAAGYVRRVVSLVTSSSRTVDVRLVPAGSIEGQVVTPDGQPVAGALVEARGGLGDRRMRNDSDKQIEKVRADGRGRFRLEGLSSGPFRLSAHGDGVASAVTTAVDLAIAETVGEVVLVVEESPGIYGVVTRAGEPVAGAQVTAYAMQTREAVGLPSISDGQGQFALGGLGSGVFVLSVSPQVGASETFLDPVLLAEDDVRELALEIRSGVEVSGHVSPDAPATITIKVRNYNDAKGKSSWMILRDLSERTQSDGGWRIPAVPVGKYFVNAVGADGSFGRADVDVAESAVSGVQIDMSPRASIRGVVEDEDGQPLDNLSITPILRRGLPDDTSMVPPLRAAWSAADGSFRLRGLRGGTYQFLVRDDRGNLEAIGKPAEVEVASGGDAGPVRIRVRRPDGSISGRVLDESGQPVTDAWVCATMRHPGSNAPDSDINSYRYGEREAPVLTDDDGRFVLRGLRDGLYMVEANGPRGDKRDKKPAVRPGQPVELALRGLHSVELVATLGGHPVTEYRAQVSGLGGSRSLRVRDPEGRVSIPRLEPGSYTIDIEGDSGAINKSVDIKADQDELAIELEPWCSVTGRAVSLGTDEPEPGLAVTVSGIAESPAGRRSVTPDGAAQTGSDGGFRVEGMRCGSTALYFNDAGGAVFGRRPRASKVASPKPGEVLDVGTVEVGPPS